MWFESRESIRVCFNNNGIKYHVERNLCIFLHIISLLLIGDMLQIIQICIFISNLPISVYVCSASTNSSSYCEFTQSDKYYCWIKKKWIKFVFNKLGLHGTSPTYDALILIKLYRFITSIFLLSVIVYDLKTENLLFLKFRENMFCWISWKLLQIEQLYR